MNLMDMKSDNYEPEFYPSYTTAFFQGDAEGVEARSL